MMHSHDEMEKICLDLARDADPDSASALRVVAQNYRVSSPPAPQDQSFEFRFKIMLIFVGVFYVLFWTPLFLLLRDSPLRVNVPKGAIVEQLGSWDPSADGRYSTRTYKFARSKTYLADPAPLLVFENDVQLPAGNYEFEALVPENVWRYVTLTTSDGSDPRFNGRRYYVVLP